jgi:hypothetical protein
MDRARVQAQLRNVERLIDVNDAQPLLSLVVLESGPGVMVAHPTFRAAQDDPEEREAALRLVHAELLDIAAYFQGLIDQSIRASAVPRVRR